MTRIAVFLPKYQFESLCLVEWSLAGAAGLHPLSGFLCYNYLSPGIKSVFHISAYALHMSTDSFLTGLNSSPVRYGSFFSGGRLLAINGSTSSLAKNGAKKDLFSHRYR